MNWLKKIFSIENKEEKNNIEDQPIPMNLTGMGTDKPLTNKIYKDQIIRLESWRKRYTKAEYPFKVALNTVYQLLTAQTMWSKIVSSFEQKGKTEGFEIFYDLVQQLSGAIAKEKVAPTLQVEFQKLDRVGILDMNQVRNLIQLAKSGNNDAIKDIEHIYVWYTGAVELIYAYTALGMMGYSKMEALGNICNVIDGGNPDEFDVAIQIFGTNIDMCYKPLPAF